MRFDLIAQSLGLFAQGLVMTLELTIVPILMGVLIAVPCALALYRNVRIVSPALRAFCYLICGTPLMVQLLIVYFGLAQLDFIRTSWAWAILRDPWWCAVIAFSINAAAYWIALLSGAISETPRGQHEAAAALGLTRRQATWLVVLPATFLRILPQIGNEIVLVMHASALASVVTLQDLLGVARTFNVRHYLSLDGLVVAAILYIALTFTIVGVFARVERRYLAFLSPP